MKDKKVLIEKFKGFDIFFDKESERFFCDYGKLDIHFEARTLWDIKGSIKQSQTEEVDEFYYIVSCYQDKAISKINLLTINKITKRCKYKIIQDTERSYDVGKIQDNHDIPKLYPVDDFNKKIYDSLVRLSEKIQEIEEQQKELVEQLKR